MRGGIFVLNTVLQLHDVSQFSCVLCCGWEWLSLRSPSHCGMEDTSSTEGSMAAELLATLSSVDSDSLLSVSWPPVGWQSPLLHPPQQGQQEPRPRPKLLPGQRWEWQHRTNNKGQAVHRNRPRWRSPGKGNPSTDGMPLGTSRFDHHCVVFPPPIVVHPVGRSKGIVLLLHSLTRSPVFPLRGNA